MPAAAAELELERDALVERRVATVSDPGAGNPFAYKIGGAAEQQLLVVTFVATTSVAVAARVPVVDFLDPSNVIFARVALPFTLTASHSAVVTFAVGLQQFGANNADSMGAGLPPLRLYAGLTVQGGLLAQQAADTIADVRLFLAQWPTV